MLIELSAHKQRTHHNGDSMLYVYLPEKAELERWMFAPQLIAIYYCCSDLHLLTCASVHTTFSVEIRLAAYLPIINRGILNLIDV